MIHSLRGLERHTEEGKCPVDEMKHIPEWHQSSTKHEEFGVKDVYKRQVWDFVLYAPITYLGMGFALVYILTGVIIARTDEGKIGRAHV